MIAESVPLPGESELHARLWSRGDGRERGVLILIHGLGDHGGRYETFAGRMIRRNLAVFAIDLPGHGRSPGRRGGATSYDTILRVISASRRAMHRRFGGIGQVVLGHSMGGNFVVNYILRRREFDPLELPAPAGAVLLAPMLMPPDFLDRPRIFAAWGTGQLFGWIRVSRRARVDQLTRDTEAAERFSDDPLQHSQISLYLATQLLAQGRFALDHASEIDVPTLIMHGDDDELIDQTACENLALRMRDQAVFTRWPGGRHDLLNDLDAEAVATSIVEWIEQSQKKVPGAAGLNTPIPISLGATSNSFV